MFDVEGNVGTEKKEEILRVEHLEDKKAGWKPFRTKVQLGVRSSLRWPSVAPFVAGNGQSESSDAPRGA